MKSLLEEAGKIIQNSNFTIAFTGAGISVESGIPPFRGEHGLWNKYDPQVLDLGYFLNNSERSWLYIREIFYDFFAEAKPNQAHRVLANLESNKLLNAVVTQNIDNLHYEAGSKTVYEFHGNSKKLKCLKCGQIYDAKDIDFENIPPKCVHDGEVLKPDFIFFGEGIPHDAYADSFAAAEKAEVCIIVGSTGEVTPASYVPRTAKQAGATIIEINPDETIFTSSITDIHLKGKAAETLNKLQEILF
nr:NAD-dependent protein deacylase [uncultured Draconibacterium sp.]